MSEPQVYTQYPFPLASGGMAYIHLPCDVTQDDVARLAQFLSSLVVEELPAEAVAP